MTWFLDVFSSLLHDTGSTCQPAAMEKPVNYDNGKLCCVHSLVWGLSKVAKT